MVNSPGTIFLIAVLYVPTEAERLDGKKKQIIVTPQFVLADDPNAARSKAVMLVPRDVELDPDRVEVLVTAPF